MVKVAIRTSRDVERDRGDATPRSTSSRRSKECWSTRIEQVRPRESKKNTPSRPSCLSSVTFEGTKNPNQPVHRPPYRPHRRMAPASPVRRRSKRLTRKPKVYKPFESPATSRRGRSSSIASPRGRMAAAPSGPGSSPSSPTVIDMHGAQPHDVVVSEYFTGLRNMTKWTAY